MTAARTIGASDGEESRAAGVWTLAGDRLIIAEPNGPATVLVPTEQVRLLAADLPLASRAKRMAALPFAIEDRIAEPLESVHVALGAEIAPKRYLVGIVRHEVMSAWVAVAEEAGLGQAAMVPDALALPRPAEGQWSVDLTDARAVVRSGDGGGFACPASMLLPAWQAAGRPLVIQHGAPLPSEMAATPASPGSDGLSARLLNPELDLRQGLYAARAPSLPSFWRRLGWVVALGAAAHVVIATADTLMLRAIADRRAEETRVLVATMAPNASLGQNLASGVADLLPTPASGAPDLFLPLLTRLSGALGPLAGSLNVRALSFQANTLILDLEGSDPGLLGRVEAALRSAGVGGSVTRGADGSVRVTANAA